MGVSEWGMLPLGRRSIQTKVTLAGAKATEISRRNKTLMSAAESRERGNARPKRR